MTARSEKVDMSGVIKLLSGATRTPNSGRAVEIQRISSISAFIRPPLGLDGFGEPERVNEQDVLFARNFLGQRNLLVLVAKEASVGLPIIPSAPRRRTADLSCRALATLPLARRGPTHFEFRTSKLCEVGADPLEKVRLPLASVPTRHRGGHSLRPSRFPLGHLLGCRQRFGRAVNFNLGAKILRPDFVPAGNGTPDVFHASCPGLVDSRA